MTEKQKAILIGPCVGEMYWEAARFAPVIQYYQTKTYKKENIKYIVLTREERFDLYGKYADILVPLRIEGDYVNKSPNCFKLEGLTSEDYKNIANVFYDKYKERYDIVKHVYPNIDGKKWTDKHQFTTWTYQYAYNYQPRSENYELVENYLPKDDKPLVIIAPRYRKGFKRNWGRWPLFYNRLCQDKDLFKHFNFIVCGKPGEYIPDEKDRFLDMNKIQVGKNSSKIGLLLVLLEKAFFVFGSQSAIPNLALLHKVEVMEFGCQKTLHTKTYNIFDTPVTFFEDKNYKILVSDIFPHFTCRLRKKIKEKIKNESLVRNTQEHDQSGTESCN